MDALRFDHLVRSWAEGASPRRGALRLLIGGLLALLGAHGVEGAAAHDALLDCKKIKNRKKRKKCVTKARAHNAGHANEPRECTAADTCPNPPPGQLCAQPICDQGGNCGFGPKAAGTRCRPIAGDCDIPEFCDGVSLDCPPDRFRSSGEICRHIIGPCDVAERCTGSSASCPPDAFAPSSQQCGAAAGPCDLPDFCTGSAVNCPNQKQPDNNICGANQVCCNGICCNPGLSCSQTRTCVCDPFVRCGPSCPCLEGNCSPGGVCIG